MKTLTFTYKNMLWESVEIVLKNHKLTRANIKKYRWSSEPEIELNEVVLDIGDNSIYINKKGRPIRLKKGDSIFNLTVTQHVSN